jgi:integrase/recombinase XerD
VSDEISPALVLEVRALDAGEITPAMRYLMTFASGPSRRSMHNALQRCLRSIGVKWDVALFPWHRLEREHTLAMRRSLEERHSPSSTAQSLTALRGVLREHVPSLITWDRFVELTRWSKLKASRPPSTRVLSRLEMRALFLEADRATMVTHAFRDRALLGLLYGCGLRRAEVCALKLEDLVDEFTIHVMGKGRRERNLAMPARVADLVSEWIDVRPPGPGPLLCALTPAGTIANPMRALTPNAVLDRLYRLCDAASVVPRISPHRMRHTFVTNLIDLTGDITIASRAAGHSQISTTMRYDHRADAAVRRGVAMLDIPCD